MQVLVEFFGSVRIRTGAASTTITLPTEEVDLKSLLGHVAAEFPDLHGFCIGDEGCLMRGFVVNLDGRTFSEDGSTLLTHGQTVMLLSADVGG